MIRFLLSARNRVLWLCFACALAWLWPAMAGAQDAGDSLVNSLRDVPKAVVYIEAVGDFVQPEEETGKVQISQGSGFLIAPEGLIVTNAHVVNGGEIFYVRMEDEETRYNAQLLGISECADLAVLKLAATGRTAPLPYLELATDGIEKRRVLEHSAELAPGNSGGPLVDRQGKVVGVNYAGRTGDESYAAIGSAYALPILDVLISGEDLYSVGINGEVRKGVDGDGIWVVSVNAGSPAERAGVTAGDVIVELAGLPVGGYGSMDSYCDIVRSHEPSDVLPITVARAGSGLWSGQLNGRPLAADTEDDGGQETLAAADVRQEESAAVEAVEEYERITDETGEIVIDAPAGWELFDSKPLRIGAVQNGAMLMAVDPNGSYGRYGPASIFVIAEMAIPGVSLEDTLGYVQPDDCRRLSHTKVSMAEYEGRMETWGECRDEGDGITQIYALSPLRAPDNYVTLVLKQPEDIPMEPEAILAPLADLLAEQGVIGTVHQATVLVDNLTIRAEPGTKYESIGWLNAGQTVDVWAVDKWPDYEWLYVWSDDAGGWITAYENYVELDPSLLEYCAETSCTFAE